MFTLSLQKCCHCFYFDILNQFDIKTAFDIFYNDFYDLKVAHVSPTRA